MRIERERYLSRLRAKRFNGMIRGFASIGRCGKSFPLSGLYHGFLIADRVAEERIVTLALDELSDGRCRDPYEPDRSVREKTADRGRQYHVFPDEIQKVNEVRTEWGDRHARGCPSRAHEAEECGPVCDRQQFEDAS